MAAQLNGLGLAFRRVPAFDAEAVSERWLDRHFTAKGPLGVVPKGDKCCALSHKRAWSAFLETNDTHAVIFEDDVALDVTAGRLLARSDWIPSGVDILKLEHFGPEGQRVLLGKRIGIEPDRAVREILSRHPGAAAYVMSRAAALKLLAFEAPWPVPVDHLMFNPNVSALARELHPWQLMPVIARQTPELGGTSDIKQYRDEQRHWSLTYLRRELRRAYNDLRFLPGQVAMALSRSGSLVRVRNDGFARLRSEGVLPGQRDAAHRHAGAA